ncbi:MAG: ribonuclease D, partial [Propionibacteriaceae bacterium]|nr:ribonuclease D [Propionibacteriaceae bacterium]
MTRRVRPARPTPPDPPDQPTPAATANPPSPGPAGDDPDQSDQPVLPVLAEPAGGFALVADRAGLAAVEQALAGGSDPIALDAERASGFRYYNWAYLIQLKSAATGIRLIDPIALTNHPPADLSTLNAAMAEREWVLHAANQDLPCLAELGLRPTRLFDTELAARLLGRPRVGLGPLAEDILGYHLLKQYSSADWSTRPLPDSWLVYA